MGNYLQLPNTTSSISTFILDGTHIYGLSISQDLTILDISDPSDITELAVYEIPFPFMSFPLVFAESVVRRGDNLIVSASEPFQTGMIGIVDISTPTAPVLTDSFDFLADGVFSNGVMVAAGDYAYIRTSMYSTTGPTPPATVGIGVYNISDPTDITFVRHIPVSGIIESLTVEGGYLYSAPDFIAFDLTDPADPLPLGTLSPGAGSYIDFDGNRAIYGRNIVSLTTPTNPEVITSLHSLQGLTVDARLRGDLVYAVTNEGFMILDLNDCDLVCAADYDGNTVTDFFDLSLFLVDFYAMDPNADLNDDMVFDFFDLSTFLDYFGVGCP